MKRREFVHRVAGSIAAAGLGVGCTAPGEDEPSGTGSQPRLLVFTKSSGFEHQVVIRIGDELSVVERSVTDLGASRGYETTCTKDGRVFTSEGLSEFDAILFFTTGNLTVPGTDGSPPMPAGGKTALLDAIAAGMGFIGVHCASDTFHSGDWTVDPASRFRQQSVAEVDPYIGMLGGEFLSHGAPQTATVTVADADFPGMPRDMPQLRRHGEWYSLKNFAPDLHALLVLDTAGMDGADYQRPPYPVAWARRHGQGRVFYSALGHFEEEWSDPVFLEMLGGALEWVSGRVDTGIAPNLERVTPGNGTMPPVAPA